MPDVLQEQEFLELLAEHDQEFRAHVHHRVWNSSDHEDVFADAIATAWENRRRFTPGTNFRSWMYRILTNKAFVHNRKSRRLSIALPATLPDDKASGREDVCTDPERFIEQISDDVASALKAMRPPERRCILLRAMEECSYKEIAEVLDIPVGTVMTHLSRGRARARRMLGDCDTVREFRYYRNRDN